MNQNNLFAYMASVVSQLKEERRMGTAHVYQSTLRRVMEFEGEETLDFKDLTPAWLKSFQDHLLDSRLQWNTVSTYMRMLRAIYFRAVDDGVAPYRSRLFKGVYTGTKVTVKRAVGEETFRRLSAPVDDESLAFSCCCSCFAASRLWTSPICAVATCMAMSLPIAAARRGHGSRCASSPKLWSLSGV